jgi:hypothetical protein
MTEVLNLNDALALATVLDAVKRNARVEWLAEGRADLGTVDGVARHLVRDPENAYFLGDEDDVRDAYLRVSSTFEHFLPVRDVLRLVREGKFVEAA